MSETETFDIVVSTPPTDLPHKTRQLEILELANYLKIQRGSRSGTEMLLANPAYKGDCQDLVYIGRDELRNITELSSYVSGEWKRWLIPTSQLLYPHDGETIIPAEEADDNGQYPLTAKPYVDDVTIQYVADDDGVERLTAFVTAEALPVGRGLTTREDETSGLTVIDVLPDDSTLEVVEVGGLYRVRVKDGGITSAKMALEKLMTGTVTALSIDSSALKTIPLSATVSPDGRGMSVQSSTVKVTTPGWYRFTALFNFSSTATFASATTLTVATAGMSAGGATAVVQLPTTAHPMAPVVLSGLVSFASASVGVYFTAKLGIDPDADTVELDSGSIAFEYAGAIS